MQKICFYRFRGIEKRRKRSKKRLSRYKYKYNGKEYQDELGLNVTAMDFRQYDNATGRFNSIDALSEIDSDKSTYSFARNSPLVLNDPTGFCPECEDYYEQQGYEPSGGQTFTSSGGAEYTFNEIAGQWDRTDLMDTLDEVVITGSGFDGTHGSNDDRAGVDGYGDYEDFDGYNYADGIGQLTNAATVVWGTTQLGVNQLRQVNLASSVGRAFGIGTQVAAPRLQAFANTLGTWGNRAGLAGYGLSALAIGSKLATGQTISTAETVGFGINTALVIAGSIAVGTAAAPFVATAALIYGAVELGSYIYNGQTLEQNIIGQ